MSDFILKYADTNGEMHQLVTQAGSEQELREKYTRQGFLVYSVKARSAGAAVLGSTHRKKKINMERFLILNQQFVTLIRAGLPILKGLDLLSERLTDPKLGPYISGVRDEVRRGTLLSEAFRMQGVFPKIYVTTVMAGEKSGSLTEVLDRYITYQKLSQAVRKKVIVSLLYPAVLVVMTILLIVFLVTYVVPNFAQLYMSMGAQLPTITLVLIAIGSTARSYILLGFAAVGLIGVAIYFWGKTPAGQERMDKFKMRLPLFGEIWVKYQVAQFARVLSTLLTGGIPLVQGLDTAGESLGNALLRRILDRAARMVREGQALSAALAMSKMFPPLAIDMIEVGESTGALPAMLNSVAEFYEDDVSTRMAAALSLIEPVIMVFMGAFVAFVLIALYLPIFSLADTIQ
ncbi:type II secretion system F family protein [Nevskia soli]|jgi:type IV pilus assembly protein PilC|uniref:type II secretion system F family protein n=1 Tax=Nevskia soli TaxID=418856 RepID=UPI0015D6AAC8|nr:type II secretion system F family protein [Nevskia soli]